MLRNFQNIFNRFIVVLAGKFPFISPCTEVLFLAPSANSDLRNSIKWLLPTKSVGLDGVSACVRNGLSKNVVPARKFI
jgi:hypothetical protein